MLRHPLCISLVALLVLTAPVAQAERKSTKVSAYREAVARAAKLFEAGNYAEARASFVSAYEIHKAPVLLFNIASTYRRDGELERAIELYRAFLDACEAQEPRRVLATETIAELEKEL